VSGDLNQLSKSLLPEYDHEMANTRRVLERIPDGRMSWQPHPKSMTLGRLATFLAELPGWTTTTLGQDSYDFEPADGPPFQPVTLGSRQEILDLFDANAAKARSLLAETADATFFQPWSLLRGGQTLFTLPKIAVLRDMVFNHAIHHRGQLTVYLRLNDRPVPAIYGPSADEP